jgi:hypothetical protein
MFFPKMGFDSYKLFLCFIIIVFTLPFFSFAEQYYDPITRRYIQKQPQIVPVTPPQNIQQVQQRPVKYPVNARALPTPQEIEAAQIQAEQEREAEKQRMMQIRNSSGTEAYRRFDPNRYHKTEQITITPL